MDRMLVVVLDHETKAYEGKRTLIQLDSEGSISVYGYAVVAKNADGTATFKQGDDVGPLGTLVGTTLGSLIGVYLVRLDWRSEQPPGLPVALQLTCTTQASATTLLMMFSKFLLPSKVALVAETDEDWTTPVDTRMEAIGGLVFRRALCEVKHQDSLAAGLSLAFCN